MRIYSQNFFLKLIVTILPHLLYHLLFTFLEYLLFYHGLDLLVISNPHPNHRWHQSYFNNKGAKALRDKADICIFCLFFSLEEYPHFPLENSYLLSIHVLRQLDHSLALDLGSYSSLSKWGQGILLARVIGSEMCIWPNSGKLETISISLRTLFWKNWERNSLSLGVVKLWNVSLELLEIFFLPQIEIL